MVYPLWIHGRNHLKRVWMVKTHDGQTKMGLPKAKECSKLQRVMPLPMDK